MDSIPVQGAAADRAPAAPGGAAPDERAPRGKSLYDVTKASRERRQDTGRGRGTGQADRRQRAARDLGQVRAADAGRGGKPSAEPVSSNGATDAGYAGAGLGLAAAEPSSQDRAGPGLPGQARAGATAASQAQHGRGEDAAQDAGYPVPDGQERVDEAGAQHAGTAQWAQDTDPGLDFAADQGLDYADDAGLDYTADAGLDYAGDAGLDYAGDTGQDYPGDDSWDDLAGAGESWGTGRAGPADPTQTPAAAAWPVWTSYGTSGAARPARATYRMHRPGGRRTRSARTRAPAPCPARRATVRQAPARGMRAWAARTATAPRGTPVPRTARG